MYDLATGKRTNIAGAYNFITSPDETRMAYFAFNDKLVIARSDGKAEKYLDLGDYSLQGWGYDGLFIIKDNELAFLNLKSEELQVLTQEFPNIHPFEHGWDSHNWWPLTIYDPYLTEVIYPLYEEKTNTTAIILFDVKTGVELTRVSEGRASSILPYMMPEWSEDGQEVILTVLQETQTPGKFERKLISIDRDGSVKILLNIPNDIGILRFSISPNNSYVAFWSPDPQSSNVADLALYVYDIKNNRLINYCIVSPSLTVRPIWSPDSSQLAVELLQDFENSDVLVIDIEKKFAVKIAEDAQPVGWLK